VAALEDAMQTLEKVLVMRQLLELYLRPGAPITAMSICT
jgi:hypothetical protein